MFAKKNVICIVSVLFFSGAAMSETSSMTPSAESDGQTGFNAEQSLQSPQSAQQDMDKQSMDKQNGETASNKQSGADKKPSMVDYCRKNIC